jgi:bifunctional DNA-binding transcriptional regulator/antitoxin component of YhaV-PrlF toxin-antitoxin module
MTKKTNKTKSRWTVKVEKDNFSKDYYVILPDELIEKLNWETGDTLVMDIIKIGIDISLQITKHE